MRRLALVCTIGVTAAALAVGGRARAAPLVHEITITARRFAFDPTELQVVAGQRVRLVVRSEDTVHGFAIHELGLNLHVPAGGDAAVVEFIAPFPGHYDITCSEFCGRGHAQMRATLVSTAATATPR